MYCVRTGRLCVACDSRTSCDCFLISSNKRMVVLMETKLLICGKEIGTLFSLTSCCRRLACGILNASTVCLMSHLVLYNLVITFYISVLRGRYLLFYFHFIFSFYIPVLRGQYLQLYLPLEFKKQRSVRCVLLESK